MRKLQRYSAAAGLLSLAVSIGTSSSAQTSFASSNNPTAKLRIEKLDDTATVLHVSQNRESVNYVPISQNCVLLDRSTGIAYPLQALDFEIEKSSDNEHHKLVFAPFKDGISRFELVDPTKPNAALYFKDILADPTALAGLAEQ